MLARRSAIRRSSGAKIMFNSSALFLASSFLRRERRWWAIHRSTEEQRGFWETNCKTYCVDARTFQYLVRQTRNELLNCRSSCCRFLAWCSRSSSWRSSYTRRSVSHLSSLSACFLSLFSSHLLSSNCRSNSCRLSSLSASAAIICFCIFTYMTAKPNALSGLRRLVMALGFFPGSSLSSLSA